MDSLTRDEAISRHWHPQSETFAGGDSLLTALRNGWQMSKEVFRQQVLYSGRPVTVYHITLKHHSTTTTLRVISNPFVERYIQRIGCTVDSFEEPAGALSYV